jgi:hypothetical protein
MTKARQRADAAAAKRDKDRKNKPWVANYPVLKEWLDKHNAACYHQLPRGDKNEPRSYVEIWMIPGANQPFIIQVYSNQDGWEIYTSANTTSNDETLADAGRRLGLKEV